MFFVAGPDRSFFPFRVLTLVVQLYEEESVPVEAGRQFGLAWKPMLMNRTSFQVIYVGYYRLRGKEESEGVRGFVVVWFWSISDSRSLSVSSFYRLTVNRSCVCTVRDDARRPFIQIVDTMSSWFFYRRVGRCLAIITYALTIKLPVKSSISINERPRYSPPHAPFEFISELLTYIYRNTSLESRAHYDLRRSTKDRY
jgi:hypothetical protein